MINLFASVHLDFMVDPDELKMFAVVPDAVRIKIINTNHPLIKKYLGKSGLKLADHDFSFYFKKELAEELIEKGGREKNLKT